MTKPTKISRVLAVLDAASRLPADLRPPMERRIERHLDQIDLLRSFGLTWRQIALGLPSWCQRDGTPISDDQLRGAVSRVCRKQRRSGAASTVKHFHAPKAASAPAAQKLATVVPNRPAEAPQSSLMAQLELTRKLRKT